MAWEWRPRGPHIPTEFCRPMIWDQVSIPRHAQLGKLEVRGLQASVYHFQPGFCTSVPASPRPAPPCLEGLRHLSLDTRGGAILWHPRVSTTHFYLPPASSPTGPPGQPTSPSYTLCFQPLCLCFSPSPITRLLSGPHHWAATSWPDSQRPSQASPS